MFTNLLWHCFVISHDWISDITVVFYHSQLTSVVGSSADFCSCLQDFCSRKCSTTSRRAWRSWVDSYWNGQNFKINKLLRINNIFNLHLPLWLALISGQNEQRKEYRKQASIDDMWARYLRHERQRQSKAKIVGPIALNHGESFVQFKSLIEPLVLERIEWIEQTNVHKAQRLADVWDVRQRKTLA